MVRAYVMRITKASNISMNDMWNMIRNAIDFSLSFGVHKKNSFRLCTHIQLY